tara:strand:+ start:252 stop:413 length:162 start_codon:yes stop_codon:yes gene_type:complete
VDNLSGIFSGRLWVGNRGGRLSGKGLGGQDNRDRAVRKKAYRGLLNFMAFLEA